MSTTLALTATDEAAVPLVGIIMGSDSDLPVMQEAADILREFAIPYEMTIASAHRTPRRLIDYAEGAAGRGLHVIIAGAGGGISTVPAMAESQSMPVR